MKNKSSGSSSENGNISSGRRQGVNSGNFGKGGGGNKVAGKRRN